jgi:hypothetical protein
MDDEPHVRVGSMDDLDWVMDLVRQAAIENAFVEPDIHRLLQTVYPALMQIDGIVGVIGTPGKPLEGGVLLRMGTVWYSDEVVIEEKSIFVGAQYRSAKGGRARKLAEFAKAYSDRMGMTLAIGVLSNQRTEAKIRLYERTFGAPTGVFFLYNGRTGLEGRA